MKKMLNLLVALLLILAYVPVVIGENNNHDKLKNNKSHDQDSLTQPVQNEVIKILAIGNSFSADAIEQELYGLFNAVGQKVIIGNMYIGGCSLQKHWEKATSDAAAYSYRKIVDGVKKTTADTKLSTALKDEEWDFISFQQGAGNHGVYETFEPELTQLINYCRNNASKKDFKVIYHVPWVAQADYTGPKFGIYDYNQSKMYSMIVNATQRIASEHSDFTLVMNVMDAIENGKTSFLGDTFCRDGWHLNKTYGRYTASCLWFEKIMGQSVVGNSYYPTSISAAVAEVCQHAAHEACANPYMITDLSHFVNPDASDTSKTIVQTQ